MPVVTGPSEDEPQAVVPGMRGGSFPIVGVGASAGGLEAFTELLESLPLDTGMGFVLVQHLDPQHESALTQILTRATAMPVGEVTDKMRVEANHVYVIPPNTNLGIAQGVLRLQPRKQTRTPQHSIDSFFEALAEDQRERAIGVILSGTASDGTLGLEAIKAEGGITFAQDDSARYDSMPRSAVAAGCVDLVLSPKSIAKELARIAKHPFVSGQATEAPTLPEDDRASATAHENDETPLPSGGRGTPRTKAKQARAEAERGRDVRGAENGFKKILLLLRNHCGVDFSLYKSATIQRRLTRRMVLSKHNTLKSYAGFLRGNAKELDALYSDVLISVTSFFRSPEAFDVLQRKVIPKLLEQREDKPLRVWVLGCSTGQEAYSIAMAFVEAAEKAPRMRKLQVFATDLNEALLDKARHGLYAKSLAQDISPERLRRFFVEEEGGYRVVKPLREMVVFARQNLIGDPPFSRMDLISCRNLLIYLEPSLQMKALPTFHYALKPEGFLFLGASESIGGFTDLFEPVDKKHRIYSKRSGPTAAPHLPVKQKQSSDSAADHATRKQQREPGRSLSIEGKPPEGFHAELNTQREADRVTANEFAPPGVLINAELQILQFRGPTSAYLQPPTGKASFDVLKMARQGLMLPLRAAIDTARKTNKAARKEHVRVEQNGKVRTVNVQVIPLKNLRDRCFLILFEDGQKAALAAPTDASAPRRAASGRTAELEAELSETRDYLQSVQEQYEAANEELQASNEEIQSANEELQSVNEELETSKEELESANEELTTVNQEMDDRNAELSGLNSDLVNIQTSSKLAIVLLGRDLTIRRFSAQAERQFNLLATDVGRPFGNARHELDLPDVEPLIAEVIDDVREQEREVQDKHGRWFSLRVRPYFTPDKKVDGAVLVLVDIDDLKRSQQTIAAARDYAEGIVGAVPDPLVILNADLRVQTANESFYSTLEVSPAETEGSLIYELGDRQWNIPGLRQLLEEILPLHSVFHNFEVTHDFETLGRRTMLLNARRLGDASILLGIHDVTDVMRSQAAARQTQARNQALVEASAQIFWTADSSGAVVEDSPSWRAFTGQTHEERMGLGWLDALHPDDRERILELWKRAVADRVPLASSYRIRHASGEWRWSSVRATPVLNADGSVREWVGMNSDITERKKAEESLRQSEEVYRTLFASAPMAIFVCDRNAVIQSYNRRAVDIWGREPTCGVEQHCGSTQLWLPDGTLLPHAQSPIVEVLRTGVPALNVEVAIERPDGSRVPVLVNFAALTNPQGEISGAITSFVDITDRKRVEDALREGGRRLRFVMDSMPQKVFTAKLNGDVDYFNPQWTEFTGLSFEQIKDWGWRQFIHPDDVVENVRVWQHSIDTGEPFQFEHRFRRADGEYRWHFSRAMPLRDEGGRVMMWVGSNTDVHEQRLAADELRHLASQLSDADRRKNEFLAMLSHELRNPLAAISNAVHLLGLERGGENHTHQQARRIIERQMGQLQHLVDDLLEVSRITSGRIHLRREWIAVSDIVESSVETVRPLIAQRGHELTATLPPEPIRLYADAARLEQVVVNLLTNAAKFTEKGGHISLTVEQEGNECVLRVLDTGVGIRPETLPRIFDLFTQAERTMDRSQGGLGIGLTLVQRLTELHGGKVEVHSTVGQGSEFVVRLPVATAEAPEALSTLEEREPTQQSLRVLVVDDSVDMALSLAMLLEESGHDVRTAHDGPTALQAALDYPPDVVLLDIGLPGLNGYEVAKRLRQQPILEGVVLIALTGYGSQADRQTSLEAGFDYHLVKPTGFKDVHQMLATISEKTK